MLEQKLRNRQPSALGGLGLVALVVLAVLAGSVFFNRLAPRLGTLASVAFIAYGAAIAWLLLNWYAMGFIYTANADCLRVCRTYGKRERFMADVWLNRVQGYGTLEEMKQRFPGARVAQATRPQCEFEPLTLAYQDSDRMNLLVIQPNDAMREHLIKAIRK